jgi:dihydropteroate synthase
MAVLDCGGRPLDLGRTAIMGILNVTPDSFSDGGDFISVDVALRHAHEMATNGAAIIDIGGESTRPGAQPVSVQQELDRVIPVIEAVGREVDLPLSIDTSKPDVMRAAVAAGAGFINDVYALRAEGALETAAALEVPVCLMHMLGEPRTMQLDPAYGDVVAEISGFLRARVEVAQRAGIPAARLVVDPGFGFGKTVAHNLDLLRRLDVLQGLGVAVLAGLSRKSLIGKLLDLPVENRVHASVALALIAVAKGARLLRVHDVAETVQAVRMWEAVYPAVD